MSRTRRGRDRVAVEVHDVHCLEAGQGLADQYRVDVAETPLKLCPRQGVWPVVAD
jgi:hypothetical protein